MSAVCKLSFKETNKVTSEFTINKVTGVFEGVKIKERFINENVNFTDLFFIVGGQEYPFEQSYDVEIKKPNYEPDVPDTFQLWKIGKQNGNIKVNDKVLLNFDEFADIVEKEILA